MARWATKQSSWRLSHARLSAKCHWIKLLLIVRRHTGHGRIRREVAALRISRAARYCRQITGHSQPVRLSPSHTSHAGICDVNTFLIVQKHRAMCFEVKKPTCEHTHGDASSLARRDCSGDFGADGIRDAHDRQQRQVLLQLLCRHMIAAAVCRQGRLHVSIRQRQHPAHEWEQVSGFSVSCCCADPAGHVSR